MQYIKGLKDYHDDSQTAVTLGKFDGVHRGHEKLVEKVIEYADTAGVKSVVCAFDMLAFSKKHVDERCILMTKEEREDRLHDRVDYLVDCPFTREFSQVKAEDFIRDVLVETFHASYVVVGTDFTFGYKKRGDIHMLKEYEKVYGYHLVVIEKERYHDREISSTYIREVLNAGDIPLANTLLGYPYRVIGCVEHGKRLGRTLGFPTLNVAPNPNKLMPPNGVYAVQVKMDGKVYGGIANVGVKPTVTNENRKLVEAFLYNYSGNAYGKEVEIEFCEYHRPEQKFHGVDELKACVDTDILYGKEYFKQKSRR